MPTPHAIDQFGPPPFRFTPAVNPMVCRAFSRTFCLLAVSIVLGCAYWVYALWSTGKLTAGTGAAAGSGLSWSLAALALMAYTLWCILTSVTTLSSSGLEQTFVWNKKLELRELAYVKLIRVPGLDWLIAPRLYCRTLLGKFAVFYTSDVKMVAEFERLRDELSAFRKVR
jgi:ABC-type multidrug transport system fused ATPase/permease subunit